MELSFSQASIAPEEATDGERMIKLFEVVRAVMKVCSYRIFLTLFPVTTYHNH